MSDHSQERRDEILRKYLARIDDVGLGPPSRELADRLEAAERERNDWKQSSDYHLHDANELRVKFARLTARLEPWFAKLDAFERSQEEQYVHPASWRMAPQAVELARDLRAALASSPGVPGQERSRGTHAEEALKKYGVHKPGCDGIGGICDCGLREALSSTTPLPAHEEKPEVLRRLRDAGLLHHDRERALWQIAPDA